MISNEDAKQKIEDSLDDSVHKLSTWEANFLDDIQNWEDNYTENQLNKIEELHAKHCQ